LGEKEYRLPFPRSENFSAAYLYFLIKPPRLQACLLQDYCHIIAMKNRLFFLTLLLVGLMQCGEEGEPQNQLINFAFDIQNSSGGRIQPLTLPPGASVYISISNTIGEPVLRNHKIEIFKSGDQYVTRSIELKPARYEITDFLITDEDDSVLYVIPKHRPDLPALVEHSLPFNFDLVNKPVRTFAMNVCRFILT
jgi:hypothetical protein